MREPFPRSSFLLTLLIASSASAVTMAWTPVGNPGNACETQPPSPFGAPGGCFGAVGYEYSIGTYEVTNAQYADFLNAKAASDPYGLYDPRMISGYGGITRSGGPGSYTYTANAGQENNPVNYVTFYDAARFANWMNNGQGSGDTETGAYTLLGGTEVPSNAATVTRNAGATIVLPSEDEWYKAAYYDAVSSSYFDYPAGTNAQTRCVRPPTATPNRANCFFNEQDPFAGTVTPVGSYTGSPSPYGTFDQGGNVQEWNEAIGNGVERGLRGGGFFSGSVALAASSRYFQNSDPSTPHSTDALFWGFRIAMVPEVVPEPGTGLLVIAGLLGLAGWRRVRA